MSLFIIVTSLFTLSTVLSFINARWIKLPGVIGVMLLSILTTLVTVVAGQIIPNFSSFINNLANAIDFSDTLLEVLLGFLLFSTALQFDINRLKAYLSRILIISTVGVLLSTLIFAGMLYYVLEMINLTIPFIFCLLFGALIAPTDAVAVSALLKETRMPKRLETIISGESLFNDGIGIVLFISFLRLIEIPERGFSLTDVAMLFAREVFGGLLIGVLLGWIATRMIRSIVDFQTIVLITLTLVMCISVIGGILFVSIPLAVVAAGLLVRNRAFINTKDHVNKYLQLFWKLVDDLLNIILFVLLGLQMGAVSFSVSHFIIGAIAVVLLLVARALSITLPIIFLKRTLKMQYNSIFILTWAGLRGAISIALALSIPATPFRETLLAAAFFIVVFSVLVQGLTLNSVVNKLVNKV
ncbi:cation:proton antiporter [Arcticibacter sp.]|uniref:cation:proton antiporter n=1 Tax=Arcticibacter sp. TaxID=1872630 RepID=UPI003890900A